MSELDRLAAETYRAMVELPSFALLANVLLSAATNAERDALLAAAAPEDIASALSYASAGPGRERERRLSWLRSDSRRIAAVRHYFATAPEGIPDFISCFGVTTNPQVVASGRSAVSAFELYPRQRELVGWFIDCWHDSKSGVLTKSRMIGASYCATATLCSLAIFNRGFVGGIASATEAKLDNGPGDPGSVFYKLREFVAGLPVEFAAGWSADKTSFDKRMFFPESGSSIIGEVGDKAGRSGRSSMFIVDESAWFEHPGAMDANLSANTKCRLDMSTPRGLNEFWERSQNPALEHFRFHWRDLKGELGFTQQWYEQMCMKFAPHIIAAEFDLDFTASLEGVVISQECVQAMIDLDEFLGIEPSGAPYGGLDVADRGSAKCSFAIRRGICLEHVEQWPGGNTGLRGTARRAFALCDQYGVPKFAFDADGLGGPLHGDALEINAERAERGLPKIRVEPYRGSAAPLNAEQRVPGTPHKAKDYFSGRKAESWWWFRLCAIESLKARRGEPYNADMIISISSKIPCLTLLCSQLSQATAQEVNGKIKIDKYSDGISPDAADAVIIAFAPTRSGAETFRRLGELSRRIESGELNIDGTPVQRNAAPAARAPSVTAAQLQAVLNGAPLEPTSVAQPVTGASGQPLSPNVAAAIAAVAPPTSADGTRFLRDHLFGGQR